jgi:DNA polymerase-3 subunit epsilon
MNYCIVDIETTGARKKGQKITEIAIIQTDGQKVLDQFQTLIHPERKIPHYIQRLTGITDAMVGQAPKFYEVAKQIVQMTENCVFVAHNVYFDFQFLKQEFAELGYRFARDKLCTVRLSRKVFPGHASYSLGKLCKDRNIPLTARHRAMGDAHATYLLFQEILAQSPTTVQNMLIRKHADLLLPTQLKKETYDNLPEQPGVYYFWDEDHNLLYIGKSVNIRKRVQTHFRLHTKVKRDLELKKRLAHITFKTMGNELAALLFETQEIGKHRPIFNRAMRYQRFEYALRTRQDNDGFIYFNVCRTRPGDQDALVFSSRASAAAFIKKMHQHLFALPQNDIRAHQTLSHFKKILGQDAYNQKILHHLQTFSYPSDRFSITLKGRTADEQCLVHIKDQKLHSIQYLSEENQETIELQENPYMKQILLKNLPYHCISS